MEERNAGFWIRFAARFLDGIIFSLPISIIVFLLTGDDVREGGGRRIVSILNILYAVLLPIFWDGQTIGKRICRIRIRRTNGAPLGIGTMLIRDGLIELLYSFTYGLAVLVSAVMVAARRDKRAIHDFAAGTEVVKDSYLEYERAAYEGYGQENKPFT
ncbi:RDD family protein [Paenibacillus sp. HN-1]|uniref:RDD family protein n=1 Tax=Paenibacillus TaxID=44249 RepID=UPI001CA9F6F7|nr:MULTISPECIES: RDD family protein [Paenibacillus]MBY9081140.1 RDD family protein [Paenibacillus sp. CGMCC 1.18879]MBY9087177.1 RDD family protein [Paenibacillus sinensis]